MWYEAKSLTGVTMHSVCMHMAACRQVNIACTRVRHAAASYLHAKPYTRVLSKLVMLQIQPKNNNFGRSASLSCQACQQALICGLQPCWLSRWSEKAVKQLEEAAQSIPEGHLKVHMLPNAGHWVHADNPQGLLDMIEPAMQQIGDTKQR